MKRAETFPFVRRMAKANRVRFSTVRAVLDSFAEELRGAVLERGEVVRLPGFGTFYAKKCKARRVRNPQTKELMLLAPSVAVGFKAGKGAKRREASGQG